MSFEDLVSKLEDEIEDPEEETFLLFARPIASSNLGFIDPKARSVDVTVSGRDYTIHQSPNVLSSTRAGGTTGAVLWKITPLFASYISSPNSPLAPFLTPQSSILELGCGISPLTALALSPSIGHYILSDQPYVQKFIAQNIAENPPPAPRRGKGAPTNQHNTGGNSNVVFKSLDWETDTVSPSLSPTGEFDVVVACDCVYNDALVKPLVQTCADACRLGRAGGGEGTSPAICIVAQQLRSDDVFQLWLSEFHKHFRAWRFPDHLLPEGLRPDDGFVIHVGILRR